jgi:hypothetical protein
MVGKEEKIKVKLISTEKTEAATFELRKIELASARFETERIRRIKELEFKQAEIAYKKELRKRELNRIHTGKRP